MKQKRRSLINKSKRTIYIGSRPCTTVSFSGKKKHSIPMATILVKIIKRTLSNEVPRKSVETEEFLVKKKALQELTSFHEHPQEVQDMINGGLIGDLSVERQGNANPVLRFVFSAKHLAYATYIKKFYSERGYCNTLPLKITKKKGTKNLEVRFASYSIKSFIELHQRFYRLPTEKESKEYVEVYAKKRKKRLKFVRGVPKDIEKSLTPLALAVWLMDDGTKTCSGILLCTDSFSKDHVQILRVALKAKYNINTTLRKRFPNKEQWRIYILAAYIPLFISIVKPYVIPSMLYKLGLDESGLPLKKKSTKKVKKSANNKSKQSKKQTLKKSKNK